MVRQLALAQASQWRADIHTMEDLNSVIIDLNDAFVEWRYLHEETNKARKITFPHMIFLAEILHATCQEGLKQNPPA